MRLRFPSLHADAAGNKSCDVHVNYLRVRDVQTFLLFAIIPRLLIESFWLLSDGKMLRLGLTEMLSTLKLLQLSRGYLSWSTI